MDGKPNVMDGSVKKKIGYYLGWKKVLGIWRISWITVSLCIFTHMNSQGLEQRKQTLASLCDERSRMLQHQFAASLISIFLHSKNPSATDHETSARFTERTTFERPLAYAVRVLQDDFDKEQGWSIKSMINTMEEDEWILATDGYLGGVVFDVESLVEKLLQQVASEQKIFVNVYDTTNLSNPISMYGSDVSGNDLEHVSHLNFGDPFRRHEMRCRFKQKPPRPRLAITTAAGILVIAFLIGHIFHATVSRIAKLEDDYEKMMMLKEQAEAADVAKSQILATVFHEIRTPVNGVLDTHLDVTQQDYVKTAQKSALQHLPPHQPYSSFGSYGGVYMGMPPYGSSMFNGSRIHPYDVPFSGGSAYPYDYGRGLPGGGRPYPPLPLSGPPPYSGGSMMGNVHRG